MLHPSDQRYLDDLNRNRMAVGDEMRAMIQKAEAHNKRGLTGEEDARFRELENRFDRISSDIAKIVQIGASPLGEKRTLWESASVTSAGPSDFSVRAAFSAFERQGYYAFDSYNTPGMFESRALGGNVGTAIPTTFADFVVTYERTLNPLLDPGISKILERDTNAPLVIPRVTGDVAISGTVTAEAAGITEADPTISQVTLTSYKYGVTTLWSSELAQDNTIGLEQLVAETNGRALALAMGTALTTGDGSGKPTGFLTNATNLGTASGTATGASSWTYFGPQDMIAAYYKLAAPYRARATWMVSTDAISKIVAFRDSQNQPLFVPGFGGAPNTFLGRPIVENPAMASVSSASKSVAVGDFSRFVVSTSPLRVDLSRDYKYASDQIALRTIQRIDSNLVDVAAVGFLVSAAS